MEVVLSNYLFLFRESMGNDVKISEIKGKCDVVNWESGLEGLILKLYSF